MSDINVEVVGEPSISVEVNPVGGTGPEGPSQVSADAGNAAILGTDNLIYVPESAGGSGVWGDITGTLADQTDLQGELDGKSDTGHTHAQADVTGLAASLAGKSDAGHTHAQSDVTGLTSALSGKSDTGHTHAQSDVTGLTAALAGKADTTHTHAQSDVTGLTSALAGKSDTGHTHTASNVTDFNSAADARVVAGITGKLDTSAAPELIRDTMGTALVAGTNITLTVNDAGDTITVADTVSPIAAGSANNPHTTKTATRNSALPKNWWRYAGTPPADNPTNWVDGDEWITV